MKPLRLLLVFSGILLVLVGVAIVLALTPSVQRWAVLRATHSVPGLKFEARTISAGLSQVHLADAQIERNGLRLEIGKLDADYSLSALLFSRRLVIDRVTGDGLVIDASRLSPDRTRAAA